jgi:hypothetical protein
MKETLRTIQHIGRELVPWALLCLIVTSTGAAFKIYQTAEVTRGTTIEVREAARKVNTFLTEERLIEQHDRLVHSNDALQIMANTYSEVGNSTKTVIDDHVAPAIDLMSLSVDQRLQSMDRKMGEFLDVASVQVGRNGEALYRNQIMIGDSVNASIVTFNRRLSAPEIDSLLADLAAAGHKVRVTTEDPALNEDLRKLFANAEQISANTAETTKNLARTSGSVDRYVEEKLFPPPPKGFWGKFKHGLKVTVQWVALAGGAAYPIVRLAQ